MATPFQFTVFAHDNPTLLQGWFYFIANIGSVDNQDD
jgi:hypothetical protein